MPGLPSAEELAALPHGELAARLAEAYWLISEMGERLERLERRVGRDSATSSRPPSSDGPYKKRPRDRSLRERGKRAPGSSRASRAPRCAWWMARITGSGIRLRPAGRAARTCPGRRSSRIAATRSPTFSPPLRRWSPSTSRRRSSARAAARSARGRCRPGCGTRQLRPGDLCAGREPELRELRPVPAGGGADGRDGRDYRLRRLDRRGPGEGRRAGGIQRVHGPGERAAAASGGGARG